MAPTSIHDGQSLNRGSPRRLRPEKHTSRDHTKKRKKGEDQQKTAIKQKNNKKSEMPCTRRDHDSNIPQACDIALPKASRTRARLTD